MTQRIYFLRHGKALSRSGWDGPDDLRPLTPDGEAAVQRAAAAMARHGLAPEVIVTSPLVRALRTAEIVAEALGRRDRMVVDERLAHGFDARCLAKIVAAQQPSGPLMVVGHEPEFSATVAELIGGGDIVFKKGGLARVDATFAGGSSGCGELVWLLTPTLLDMG